MRALDIFRRVIRSLDPSTHSLEEIAQGIKNQSSLLNNKLEALIQASDNQSSLINNKLEALIQASVNESKLLNEKLDKIIALQQAQIVMQKDQTDSFDGLSALLDEFRQTLAKNETKITSADVDRSSVPPAR
jgi:hypothetical protein